MEVELFVNVIIGNPVAGFLTPKLPALSHEEMGSLKIDVNGVAFDPPRGLRAFRAPKAIDLKARRFVEGTSEHSRRLATE